MSWLFPISLLILFELVADFFSKKYSLDNRWWFWGLALLSYVIANIFWLSAMKNGSGLVRGANIFSVGSAIVASVLGYYFFQEKLSATQMVGVILGIVALILILTDLP